MQLSVDSIHFAFDLSAKSSQVWNGRFGRDMIVLQAQRHVVRNTVHGLSKHVEELLGVVDSGLLLLARLSCEVNCGWRSWFLIRLPSSGDILCAVDDIRTG